MNDERDDRRADTIEDGPEWREPAEVDVQGSQRSDDKEVREDEGPSTGPRPPEATAEVGDEDPDLDGQWSGQRLTHCHSFPKLFLVKPFPLLDQVSFHLAHEGDRPAEAEGAEAQKVCDQV